MLILNIVPTGHCNDFLPLRVLEKYLPLSTKSKPKTGKENNWSAELQIHGRKNKKNMKAAAGRTNDYNLNKSLYF